LPYKMSSSMNVNDCFPHIRRIPCSPCSFSTIPQIPSYTQVGKSLKPTHSCLCQSSMKVKGELPPVKKTCVSFTLNWQ